MGIPTRGLGLYLPFYSTDLQGSPFTSKDINGLSVTVVNAIWGASGRTLDGISDYMTIPHNAALNIGVGDFSICAWIWVDSGCATPARIVSKQGAAWYFFRLEGGIITISIKDTDGDSQTQTGTNDLRDDGWHFVACTCDRDDAAGLQCYEESVAEGAATDPTGANASLDNTSTLYLGSYNTTTEEFTGIMGEVLMYNRVLTQAEIDAIYLETARTYVACWDFATWA